MINVSTETNIERLREVAQVLLAEKDRLHRRLQALVEELGKATGEDAARLQLELEFLREQLHHRNQTLFGTSSEKRSRERDEVPAKPQRGHGPKPQPELPILEVVYELDRAARGVDFGWAEMAAVCAIGRTLDDSAPQMSQRIVWFARCLSV